jgi:hypothetical protein
MANSHDTDLFFAYDHNDRNASGPGGGSQAEQMGGVAGHRHQYRQCPARYADRPLRSCSRRLRDLGREVGRQRVRARRSSAEADAGEILEPDPP